MLDLWPGVVPRCSESRVFNESDRFVSTRAQFLFFQIFRNLVMQPRFLMIYMVFIGIPAPPPMTFAEVVPSSSNESSFEKLGVSYWRELNFHNQPLGASKRRPKSLPMRWYQTIVVKIRLSLQRDSTFCKCAHSTSGILFHLVPPGTTSIFSISSRRELNFCFFS